MKKRPTSLTVISWILIVLGGISIISTTAMINNPVALELMRKSPIPIPIQYAISYIGLLVMIVSGIAILKRQNWARFLYVTWSAIGFVISILTSPMKAAMIPSLVVFLIIAFFLFRPKASEYFIVTEVEIDA